MERRAISLVDMIHIGDSIFGPFFLFGNMVYFRCSWFVNVRHIILFIRVVLLLTNSRN